MYVRGYVDIKASEEFASSIFREGPSKVGIMI
jgi:hypothetical protein